MENKTRELGIFKSYWFWITLSFLIIIIWGLNWILVDKYLCYEQGGQFGDRFGATTSLFGGFTILGLFFTIYLQQKQISLQLHEIEEQKNQIKEDKEQKKLENETSIFFHLMNFQNKTLENVSGLQNTKGLQVLIGIEERLNKVDPTLDKNLLDGSNNISKYRNHINIWGAHYLHHVNAIQTTFDHIISSVIFTEEHKKQYIKIFKSQLSKTELILWGYELYLGAPFINIDSLKKRAAEYGLFDNLTEDDAPISHVQKFKGRQ